MTASFMISLPTIMALFNMAPDAMTEVIGYVLGGVLLGCLLPDVDASDAKVMHGYHNHLFDLWNHFLRVGC